MNRKKKVILIAFTILILLLSCSKEPIKEFTTYTLPEYVKKALPTEVKGEIKYQAKIKTLKFSIEGGFIKIPSFGNSTTVDFSESFYWALKYSENGVNKIIASIDTLKFPRTFLLFTVVNTSYSSRDSIYNYVHIPLPADSVLNYSNHKFYSKLIINNREYKNCFEIYGGGIYKATKLNKLIYNYTDGILYFDAAGGESFTIYKP